MTFATLGGITGFESFLVEVFLDIGEKMWGMEIFNKLLIYE